MPHVVLIVDEDPFLRQLIARQLEGLAVCVEVAPHELTHVLRQYRFDLVVAGDETNLRLARAEHPGGRRMLVTAQDLALEDLEPVVRDRTVHCWVRMPCTIRRMRRAVVELLYADVGSSSSAASSMPLAFRSS